MSKQGTLSRVQAKIVLLGESGVGKTALSQVYTGKRYQEYYRPTTGVNIRMKADGMMVSGGWQWQIWDFAGKPQFRPVRTMFYPGAEGALLVYDITNQASLASLPEWLKELSTSIGTTIPLLVVGNKVDLRETELTCLTTERGQEAVKQLQEQFGLPKMGLVETSAKTPTNLTKAFDELRTLIQEKKEG